MDSRIWRMSSLHRRMPRGHAPLSLGCLQCPIRIRWSSAKPRMSHEQKAHSESEAESIHGRVGSRMMQRINWRLEPGGGLRFNLAVPIAVYQPKQTHIRMLLRDYLAVRWLGMKNAGCCRRSGVCPSEARVLKDTTAIQALCRRPRAPTATKIANLPS